MAICHLQHTPDNRITGNIPDFFLLTVPLVCPKGLTLESGYQFCLSGPAPEIILIIAFSKPEEP